MAFFTEMFVDCVKEVEFVIGWVLQILMASRNDIPNLLLSLSRSLIFQVLIWTNFPVSQVFCQACNLSTFC